MVVAEQFNYFTEIEEHFCRRRGTAVLLSTLDWALIETWKEAGIPLEAVLRGIDEAFDRYDARPKKTRKVNSLAYCAQQVLTASEEVQESSVGAPRRQSAAAEGLEANRIADYLERNAGALDSASVPDPVKPQATAAAETLRMLAQGQQNSPARLEDLERRLTIIEEKLFAALQAATGDEELVGFRAEADRDLAPYRRNLTGTQIEHLQRQYLHKRLLERYRVPRLSLFYM